MTGSVINHESVVPGGWKVSGVSYSCWSPGGGMSDLIG